jgi:pyruvate kinase
MRRERHAKIVATLGPASTGVQMIRSLFVVGVDVFRLNFSHGTHGQHGERLAQIRQVEQEVGRPIGWPFRSYSARKTWTRRVRSPVAAPAS